MTADSTNSRWKPFWQPIFVSTSEESGQATQSRTTTKSKTWEASVTRVPSWPEEAKALKSQNWLQFIFSVGDVLLVILPIYFILLGVATATLNGKPTKGNAFGSKVEFAMDLGPTMFPIVFAAISGRSMKMIARYLVEKGAKISTLELLMASQSVWGTIESQFLMQRLTVVGINLLFLWALSPLGGQASLRLMERGLKNTYHSNDLRYMTTGPAGTMWGLSSTYVDSGKFADAGALYTAALLAPQSAKIGPQDPWGNVKIPSLESIGASTSDSDGWILVSNVSTPETYSSLVGLPIVGLPSVGNSSFTVESTYLVVECSQFSQKPYPGAMNDTNSSKTNYKKLDELVPGEIWSDKSESNDPFEPSIGDKKRDASFFLDTNRGSPWSMLGPDQEALLSRLNGFIGYQNQSRPFANELTIRRELFYVSKYATSRDENTFGLNIGQCLLSQQHVEAMIRCIGTDCAAIKIRKSHSDTRPSAFTGLEHGVIMDGFARQFPTAVTFNVGSSPTEHFLANTSNFPFVQQVGHLAQNVSYTDLSKVAPAMFSRRLSMAMNTYYQLSVQPTGYFGNLPTNLSVYGPDTKPVNDIDAYLPKNMSATGHSFFNWYPIFEASIQDITSPFIGATTTANVTSVEEIFSCNFAWLSLLFTSSFTILTIGGVALVLKHRTLGPEMFGFVTSMTYENPHIKIPEGGSMLDAMERARLLKDVKVYVADVRGGEEVGHIAFAAGVPLRKLERKRLYY